jgi:hypothetical protein
MQGFQVGLAWLLTLLLAIPNLALGNDQKLDHVVPVDELRQALSSKAKDRALNIEEVTAFLHHESVRNYVGEVANLEKLEAALATLDDATPSDLAAQSAKANDELEAGLGTKGWTIITAVGVAVFILVSYKIGRRQNLSTGQGHEVRRLRTVPELVPRRGGDGCRVRGNPKANSIFDIDI